MPLIGNKNFAKNFRLMKKITDIGLDVEERMNAFKKATWNYDDKKYNKVCDMLSEEDSKEFFMDLRTIDLHKEGRNYQHGVAKYYLGEDIPAINSGLNQIVQMN
jgi:hypothetical protein